MIDATGEVVPLERLRYGPGGIEVLDVDGNVIAALDPSEIEPVWGCCADDRGRGFYVATSADGRHVALESIAELLDVAESEISSVARVTPVGDTVTIAVTMNDRHPDGTPRQLVLVGTPAG